MSAIDAIPLDVLEDGNRAMTICNACRYCEGFCAVFPAMERRLTFSTEDLVYLANLCHDCRECYYSCQYAPPHEFAVNVPRTFAELRRETYRSFAAPRFLVDLLGRNRPALVLSLFLSPVALLLAAVLLQDPSTVFSAHSVEDGSFYRVVPHEVMVGGFGAVGLFVLTAILFGFREFWRTCAPPGRGWLDVSAIGRAVFDSARLRYLDGGGDGCAYPGEKASTTRRLFHHATFYGFMLSFAATSVAALYHNVLGWEAPYDIMSVPVVLGILGGIGLLVGPIGLVALKRVRDPEPGDPVQARMDVTLLALLFLTSLTGLLLLLLRETAAMGVLLVVHLGVVLGLFLTMPYGKFAHAVYRFAALVRFAQEERDP